MSFIAWINSFSLPTGASIKQNVLGDPSHKEDRPFNTQQEMLKRFPVNADGGVCAQITNTFIRARLSGNNPTFLESEQQTYDEILKEAKIQDTQLQAGDKDVRHSAFTTTGAQHTHTEFSHEEMSTAKKFKEKFGKSRYGMFSRPTDDKKRTHLIAFERDSALNECGFFDPDLPGGYYKGDCEAIIEAFTEVNKLYYSNNTSRPTVAGLAL